MPRTKGSKKRSKTTHTDDASQEAEKQEYITSLTAEISSITANIDTLKADLKAKKDCFEESRKRSSNPGAKADAKVAEDAKKAEEESPLKKLFAVVMNADEILAKMK